MRGPYYLNHVGYKGNIQRVAVIAKACIIWTMWDIKANFANMIVTFPYWYYLNHVGYKVRWIGFSGSPFNVYYLNHVGYKELVINNNIIGHYQYYLNHVGYKVARWVVCAMEGRSIIWTMWDIKPLQPPYALLYKHLRIIWTMWDIKAGNTSGVGKNKGCIIWTMWDIKSSYFS